MSKKIFSKIIFNIRKSFSNIVFFNIRKYVILKFSYIKKMPHWLAIKIDIIFGIVFFLINFMCKPSNFILEVVLDLQVIRVDVIININNLIFHVN